MDNIPNIKPSQTDERAEALWPAILSLSVGVFGLVTAEFLPASLLTPISSELGVSLGAAGQAVTMTSIVAAFAGPMVVVGTAKLDRRIALVVLTILLMLSSVVAGLANNLFVLLVSRFMLGIGLGGFWALAVALAMRLVPAHQVARAVAVIMTGVSVATVCAAPIGAWVGATIGWRYAFFMAAAVGAAALLMQILSMPSLPPKGAASIKTLVAVLRRPAIRLCYASAFLIATGHFAGFTYIRAYLEDIHHFDAKSISAILLAFGIAGFFGNILGGAVSSRSTRVSIAISAFGIAITSIALALSASYPIVACVSVAAWGLTFGALPVSIQTFITKAAPDDTESAGALLLSIFMIAISTGAVAGGLIVDSLGPIAVVVFGGVSAALGGVLISVSSKAAP